MSYQDCKKIYLCRPDDSIVTVLNGVRTDTVSYSNHVKDYHTLTFEVDRFVRSDGFDVESNGYEDLGVYMHLLLEGVGYFEMQEPLVYTDEYSEFKTITAYSIDKEFESKDFVGFQVNTGLDGSLERLDPENLDELGLPKRYIEFYRSNESGYTKYSLIHIILEKMPGWSVRDEDIDPLLWGKKGSFNESGSVNLYALLNSIIAPRFECLFVFDIMNRRIKAIARDSLNASKYDTNIFIGYRNLANSIEITADEDSVYTRFNCQGDDSLNFADYNYNDTNIFDLSYFMSERYMSVSTIEKLRNYNTWRDSNRETFLGICRNQAYTQTEINTIKYRVPDDSTSWNQWDNMDEDTLQKNLDYYNALLTALQKSVDKNPQYDSNSNYVPWKKSDGSINHDAYLELLDKQENGYGGYYTYREILEYVIPYIQLAIDNLGKPENERQKPLSDIVTMWELYGTVELDALLKKYNETLTSLAEYSKPWNELTPDEKNSHSNQEDSYNIYREQYLEANKYIKEIEAQLKIENEKLTKAESNYETYTNQRKEMHSQSLLSNSQFNFTKAELTLIDTLFHDTDYVNTNIFFTSTVGAINDITKNKLEQEIALFEDSVDKLSEVCQPQYKFSVNLDNLLRLPEFSNWYEDCTLLRFIRLGVRDDYNVKLRITGITWNPCEITPDITLEFSNMITSRSGRSDLTDILQTENNRGSKNSISVGLGNIENSDELLQQITQMLVKTNMFKNSVGDVVGGMDLSGSITVSDGKIQSLVSKYIKAEKIDVGQITGDEASFNKFFANYADIEYLVADTANFKQLNASVANINNLLAGNVSAENSQVIHLTSDNVVINEAVVKKLIASKISVADLATHTASAELITLVSENGKPTIAFKGSTQQFYDSDGNVRVQIGQDGNGDFNFVVKGEDGTTALFDSTGIKKEGIPDNTIVNDMIEAGTISKDRLGFQIVEPNEYGGVDISNIYNGEGGLFGVEYNSFKTTVSEKLEKSSFQIYVYTTAGTVLNHKIAETSLYVKLYKNGEDVTDSYDDSCFIWTRESSDTSGDTYWNEQHSTGSKIITINRADILFGASFGCSFVIDGDIITQSF